MASVNAGPSEAQLEAGALNAIARNWWIVLFFGIISIVVGIFCVMQPEDAIAILAILFAIWLLVTGIFLHCAVLIMGGAYTYARVPLGFELQEWFGLARNPYDKIGIFSKAWCRRWRHARFSSGNGW